MSKKFLLILIVGIGLMPSFTFPASSFAREGIVSDGDTTIIINPFPEIDPGGRPRSTVVVPISASYISMMTSVVLSFTSNLGEIEVEVLNTITGYYDSGFIVTWPLSAIIPISGGPGHYIITFILPSGQQYQGEFEDRKSVV